MKPPEKQTSHQDSPVRTNPLKHKDPTRTTQSERTLWNTNISPEQPSQNKPSETQRYQQDNPKRTNPLKHRDLIRTTQVRANPLIHKALMGTTHLHQHGTEWATPLTSIWNGIGHVTDIINFELNGSRYWQSTWNRMGDVTDIITTEFNGWRYWHHRHGIEWVTLLISSTLNWMGHITDTVNM